MLQNFVKLFGGDPARKSVEQYGEFVERINAIEPEFEKYSDEALRAKTEEFRSRLPAAEEDGDAAAEAAHYGVVQQALDEILPEAFAAVREASKRTIGLRHYDVQLLGGVVLHRGAIAEMRTGEGKTLVATLPLYLNALAGRGVHLITVNDYLARRDARWMGPVFRALGMSVGVLQMAAVTENGKKAFLVDPERESPHEDQHHLRMVDRVEAYAADITYGTNSEFGFDYLRDNMTMRLNDRVQRGHYYAIVDEVDNVLIDEARTPLIISGPASGDLEWYGRMAQIVKQLKLEDYTVNEKDRNVSLSEVGVAHVEQMLGQSLLDPDRPEDVTPEQARLTGYLEQALRAQFLFRRNKDYLVQAGKVIIVDEFTGRLMPGRRWSDGLHQAVEAKEGVKVEPENVTYATITLQNYFRMYKKLAGMTGTALTEAEEFHKIYKLEVASIPTNLEFQAYGKSGELLEVKAKDEEGYSFSYFARPSDPEREPVFFRRKDYPDVIYRTAESKLRSIVTEIVREHVRGRPMLVGTSSVESSERLSNRLKAEPVRRLLQLALVRYRFVHANSIEDDGRLIPELQPFNEPLEKITPDALRKFGATFGMSGISLDDPENLATLLEVLRLPEDAAARLKGAMQAGVPHQVLNARKHTEESQIIAGAGAFGAVTIATNMAGRGVDIKLGGEVAEEVISAANRVLRRAGYTDPYDMTLEERRQAILKIDPSEFGIYDAEVKLFLQYFEDMERVKALGGLHVIGSERHEARRIDNQLRGRSARQGDPGSSRFYLSLEDDLMRLFGGAQVSGMMERLKVDDALPLEVRLVGNIIESSQHRVEGANFDVRKHLLEYDDVLNKQRAQIYSQRDRIFVKEDLSEDLAEMLESEVTRRVEMGLADEEGPWRLIAWLDQIQPPLESAGRLFPTYGLLLILKELAKKPDVRQGTLEIVRAAIEAESQHLAASVESLIERSGGGLDAQIKDRADSLDAYFDVLRSMEEKPRAQKLMEEVNALVHLQLRAGSEMMRLLEEEPQKAKAGLQAAAAEQLTVLNAARLIAAIQNRIGEALPLSPPLPTDADELERIITESAHQAIERRRERLGEQIERDTDLLLQRESASDDSGRLRLLLSLSQGARTVFDQRTHRQVRQVFARFSYVFLAARLLEDRDGEQVTDEILAHLEAAQTALRIAFGQAEFARISQNASRLADFGPAARTAFGAERLNDPSASLVEADRETLIESIGRYVLNEVHRQLLLGAVTELWVDYLTKVEALRVSVGLEAYAQRDPLVQYKGQASEMFQQLLEDIRGLVISRAFAARPRRVEITPVDVSEESEPEAVAAANSTEGGGKKRRRRRH